jgi:hypothetical protein
VSILFLILNAIPGLAGKFLDWQVKKANVELDGFKTGAEVDLAAFQAHLAAQVEINRMKVAQNAWWGAKLIILIAGIPASLHFGAVFLDTIIPPFGSWGIPRLPAPYDVYQWAIVQSFFLVMPVQTLASAVSQWLGRKR